MNSNLNANPDRLPPNSPESEQGLLGCLLQDCRSIFAEVSSRIRGYEVFYDGRHQVVYLTIVKLMDSNVPVDLISVKNALEASGKLAEVGTVAYLSALLDAASNAQNWEYYLSSVLECYGLRRIVSISTESARQAMNHEKPTQDIIDEASRSINALATEFAGDKDCSIKGYVHETLAHFEDCFNRGGGLAGISTGYHYLDKLTTGLKPGHMFVIAARPSMGKTSIGMNIAAHVAIEDKLDVGFFSLEMTGRDIAARMISSAGRVNLDEIYKGNMDHGGFAKISQSAAKVAAARIHIDDSDGITIGQFRARARLMKQKHDIKLLVLDYLQLMRSQPGSRENRETQVAMISSGIKSILKELGIPGIILAQINRDAEKEKRVPRPSDLRESGSIEQDADLIGLLYSPEDEPDSMLDLPVNLRLAKHRGGATGTVQFIFRKQFTRFEQATL